MNNENPPIPEDMSFCEAKSIIDLMIESGDEFGAKGYAAQFSKACRVQGREKESFGINRYTREKCRAFIEIQKAKQSFVGRVISVISLKVSRN